MKRTLTTLVPWMVLATAAYGQARSADVLYTHFDDIPVRGMRVGDECFVPIDDVQRWGWKTDAWADTVDIKAEGKSIAIPYRVVSGRQCLPLRVVIRKLGGDTEWVGNTDTLAAYGLVTSISVRNGRFQVQSSMDFHSKTMTLTDPNRIVIDLAGVRLDDKTKLDLDPSARAAQYKPNVVRVVIETKTDADLSALNNPAAHEFDFAYQNGANPSISAKPDSVVPPATKPDLTLPKEAGAVTPPSTPTTTTGTPTVLEARIVAEDPKQLSLLIPIHLSQAPVYRKPDACTLQFVLAGVTASFAPDYHVDSPSVQSVSAETSPTGTVVSLTLVRPMGAEVVNDADGFHILLMKPDVGDGRLAGKIVVVDPGHGGKDTGAHDGGIREKDLNLRIGTLLAEELTRAGATVILTRSTDVFIPLNERALIAERNHADLFISCHINSTGGSGSQTGGITFHHLGRPVSRLLAESIQQEIAKVSGLPNIGVWSDGKIYQSGFAVLRQTTMPGVLLELGFINCSRDRQRMATDDFQHSIATAVVKGIKVFLGDAQAKD